VRTFNRYKSTNWSRPDAACTPQSPGQDPLVFRGKLHQIQVNGQNRRAHRHGATQRASAVARMSDVAGKAIGGKK